MANSFWAAVCSYLEAEFDAPDAAADHELCQAIVAGRMGLHPDGWDTRSDLMAVMPQGFRGYEWVPEAYRRPIASSAAAIAEQRRETEWKPHKPKPPRPKPGPKPRFEWVPPTLAWTRPSGPIEPLPAHGEVQLTCDVCNRARFHITLEYHGDRSMKVAAIRVMGRTAGWTCIAGTDRCPACSQAAAPKSVGNGAGGNQGDEQHR